MKDFRGRVQALMDDVYNEWQKDENRGKRKWDILGGFSEPHQIAVMFGNFNNQVENGGLAQWVYNGYFHDDAERLIDYLEAGAEQDERFKTIRDIVCKLDQFAQETDCDREGYFRDPDEDGDTSFIGDMINCDAFDTWYYGHCDGDDWWEAVCGIINRAEAREAAPAGREQPPNQREWSSVLEKIREAKAAPKQPHKPKSPDKSHDEEL